jgi:hypothetical protein
MPPYPCVVDLYVVHTKKSCIFAAISVGGGGSSILAGKVGVDWYPASRKPLCFGFQLKLSFCWCSIVQGYRFVWLCEHLAIFGHITSQLRIYDRLGQLLQQHQWVESAPEFKESLIRRLTSLGFRECILRDTT